MALRRVGAVTLTALAVVLAPTSTVVATAQDPVPPESAGTQMVDEDPEFLELHIDNVTPSTVTTTSDPFVTVTGSVKNVGDRTVRDVSVRMQRAPAVASSEGLRTSLTLDQSRYDTVGMFDTVAGRLDEGQSKQFTLSLPLRSDTDVSLDITEPGVYPLMVNVNGTPEYGGAARLDDARFLLPVFGVPGSPAVPPDISSPVAVTMLWPLADRPRLAAGVPGSVTEPVRLVDDELATSLEDGGRLDELLAAAEFATRESVDRDHTLRDSLCLAVDPDLLITVENMTRGYLVVDDPSDPTGSAHEGTGKDAASAWLERARSLAATMCTTSVPFAQADLSAITEVANPDLTATAVEAPADIVDNVLGVTSLRNFVWSDAGVLDDATAQMIRGDEATTTLVAANSVDTTAPRDSAHVIEATPAPVPVPGNGGTGEPTPAAAETSTATGSVDALLFDPSVGTALAAMGTTPQTPSYTPERARYDLSDDSQTARLQDALGAVSWSALEPEAARASGTPRSLMVVPPQLWTAGADDAKTLLSTVSSLMRSGLATPRPLPALLGRQPGSPEAAALEYPDQAAEDGVPAHLRDAAATQMPRIEALNAALVDDPQAPLTPERFTAPLREDLVRSMSLAHRRDDERRSAEEAADLRADEVAETMDDMFGAVTVVSPGGVYTLASEQSPLLLVARNDLPVGITVRLQVDAPSGMTITDIGPTTLPPRGSRTLTVPTEANDSRKLVVKFSLTTADGQQLGEPTSVTVRSNAYGQALAILTACAGALLLFLAGRRLWHRFRGQPDPADEGYERS
ncbi:glycoprotein [Rhodococcus sp. WS4]|nr:glycoprotein [Rhodococcus sp. WS4]